MSDLKAWSSLAAGNNATAPNGFPEGMARSDVNNSSRELMSAVKRFWDDPDWKDAAYGNTVVQAGSTSVTVQGADVTSAFKANCKVRVRASSSNPAYAFVASSSYGGSDTTITLEDFDTTGSPTPSTTVPADANGIDVYFIGGGDANNHGIGRSAFESGQSIAYEIPASTAVADINAAIVSAASNGKTVLLPAGTITLTDEILIPSSADYVSIRGSGSLKTILKMGNGVNKPVIRGENTLAGVTIENLRIDGNSANQTTGGHGISFAYGANQCRFRDLYIYEVWGNAIDFSDSTVSNTYSYNHIERVRIRRCGGHGIILTNPNAAAQYNYLSQITIHLFGDSNDASTANSDACGISIAGRNHVSDVNVLVAQSGTHPGTVTGAAIRLAGDNASANAGKETQVTNFEIIGDQNGMMGLQVAGSANQVSNGYINMYGTGTVKPIVVGSSPSQAAVDNCIISNVYVVDGERSEILGTATNVIVENCHFKAASEALRVGADKARINNCSFVNSSITKGIVVESGGDDVSIEGCQFQTLTGDAIETSGARTIVTDCHFKYCSSHGVKVLSGATLTNIMNCSFLYQTGNAIHIDPSASNVTVHGNRFRSGTAQNIEDEGTNTVVSRYSNSPGTFAETFFATQSAISVNNTAWFTPGGQAFSHPIRDIGGASTYIVDLSFEHNAHSTPASGANVVFKITAGATGASTESDLIPEDYSVLLQAGGYFPERLQVSSSFDFSKTDLISVHFRTESNVTSYRYYVQKLVIHSITRAQDIL